MPCFHFSNQWLVLHFFLFVVGFLNVLIWFPSSISSYVSLFICETGFLFIRQFLIHPFLFFIFCIFKAPLHQREALIFLSKFELGESRVTRISFWIRSSIIESQRHSWFMNLVLYKFEASLKFLIPLNLIFPCWISIFILTMGNSISISYTRKFGLVFCCCKSSYLQNVHRDGELMDNLRC